MELKSIAFGELLDVGNERAKGIKVTQVCRKMKGNAISPNQGHRKRNRSRNKMSFIFYVKFKGCGLCARTSLALHMPPHLIYSTAF